MGRKRPCMDCPKIIDGDFRQKRCTACKKKRQAFLNKRWRDNHPKWELEQKHRKEEEDRIRKMNFRLNRPTIKTNDLQTAHPEKLAKMMSKWSNGEVDLV